MIYSRLWTCMKDRIFLKYVILIVRFYVEHGVKLRSVHLISVLCSHYLPV